MLLTFCRFWGNPIMLRVSCLLVIACSWFLLSSPSYGEEPAGMKKLSTVEGITEYQLENGLKVLLFPDDSKPVVTVNLTIFVGSRHEGYGEAGMAHLLEHMLFKGTPTHPQVPKLLQDRGARFNGTTWLDRTNYYETLPASDDNLEFALKLEADRMVNSNVKLEDLVSEMTVVRSEFERGENSPSRVLMQRIHSAAFDWHNYGKSTIGNRSDIERVPIHKLRDFYRRHYQPDNAMLVIAGSFDEEKALAMTSKYFGALPKPDREIDLTYTEEPAQDGERTVTLRRVGDVGLVGAAWHIPASAHEDFAAVRVLSYILAMEPAGILYKNLVETKEAANVSGYSFGVHDPGLLFGLAEVRDAKRLPEVREKLISLIEGVGETGVSQEDVDRAKQQILKARELESADVSQLAVSLSNWSSQGDWRLYFLYRDRVEKVTAEKVKEVAAKYLKRSNRTVGQFIPTEKPERVEIPGQVDIAALVKDYKGREAIAQGEKFDASPENIEARTTRGELSGGIKIAMLPKKTRGEVVTVRVTLRYGSAKSLKGLVTACRLLPEIMTRGAGDMSFGEIQDALDSNLATLGAGGSVGEATFRVKTKRENLPAVLDILHKILRQPTLPEEQFEVFRRQKLANVEQVSTEPQYLANYRLRRTLSPWPKDDVRYTPTLEEQGKLYEDVTLADLKKVYNEFLGNHAGEIAVVGDFDPETVKATFEKITADWTVDQPYEFIHDKVFGDVKTGQQEIQAPGKANAVYFAGDVIPVGDSNKDYPALLLGNYIFGGGSLSSRLGDRVRQQEGLSYSVSSHYTGDNVDDIGQLTLAAITNPDNAEKLAGVIKEEFTRIMKDGVTADEVKRAQDGLLQSREVARNADGSIAGLLSKTLQTGRTMKYYSDQEEAIRELTPEMIHAAMKKHWDFSRLVIVIAGDLDKATE